MNTIKIELVMQDTRQHILEILKDHGMLTVDGIVSELCQRRGEITAITVRHHLTRLQQDGLITPELRHRRKPGRPQHVYVLTDKAQEYFPNNYSQLIKKLLEQMQDKLPSDQVNVIFDGIADTMASEVNLRDLPLKVRVEGAVNYLNEHGYMAGVEQTDQGYVLSTTNCPYHELTHTTDLLCKLDTRLINSLTGVVPRLLHRATDDNHSCAYLIPFGN